MIIKKKKNSVDILQLGPSCVKFIHLEFLLYPLEELYIILCQLGSQIMYLFKWK